MILEMCAISHQNLTAVPASPSTGAWNWARKPSLLHLWCPVPHPRHKAPAAIPRQAIFCSSFEHGFKSSTDISSAKKAEAAGIISFLLFIANYLSFVSLFQFITTPSKSLPQTKDQDGFAVPNVVSVSSCASDLIADISVPHPHKCLWGRVLWPVFVVCGLVVV